MKTLIRLFGLIFIILAGVSGIAFAADEAAAPKPEPAKITVTTGAAPREVRYYKIKADAKGTMPGVKSDEPINMDVSYALKLVHSYLRKESDGIMPMEVGVKEADISSNGEHLVVSPNTFPKLTITLDRNWQISNLYGVAGSSYEKSVPGINYGNLIMLFYLPSGNKPHAVGETWRARLKLPCYPETYDFAITLKSVDELNGEKVATVHEDISWVSDKQSASPSAVVKASADSEYQISNGKLLSSHISCDIQFASQNKTGPAQQDSKPYRANIKLDIALAN